MTPTAEQSRSPRATAKPKPRIPRTVAALSLCLALALALDPAAAQQPTGAIYGTVFESEGGRLPGVTVTLTGVGAPQVQVTDGRGAFRFLGLDPGDYALRAELDGFSTVEHPRVSIRIGRNTTLEVVMTPQVEEVITVTSESPLLDERKLTRGAHVTRPELETVPTARDPWAIVTQAPGVLIDRIAVGGTRGQQAVFGAMGVGTSENDYLLDGVQVTDMAVGAGGSSSYYDFDQLEEVQLATGGSDVTKTTAGVTLNLVTKRGTNRVRGTARYLITDESLQSSPSVDPAEFPPGQSPDVETDRLDRLEDYGLELGGPLRRDRLWIWGAAARNEIGEVATGGLPQNSEIETLALKANAQVTAGNSGVAAWNRSIKRVFGRGAGPDRQREATRDQDGETDVLKLEDTQVVGSSAVLSASYAEVDGGFGVFALGGVGPAAPESLLDADGVWKRNISTFTTDRVSEELRIEGSYFFAGGAVGHELKVGGRERTWEDVNLFSWPGRGLIHIAGVNFGFPDGPEDIVVAHRGGRNPTTEEFLSLWAQDTLSAGRWTVSLGLRYDHQEGRNDPSSVLANPAFPEVLPALEFAGNDGGGFDWETVSPRLGTTYAMGEDQKTLLRASYARFAEALSSAEVLHVNPLGNAYAYFGFTDGDGDNQWDGPHEPATFLFPEGFDPADPTALVSPNATDPGLDPAVTDELVLAIEHAVRPELVVALHLTGRRTSDVAERRPLVRDAAGEVRAARREDYVEDRVLEGTLPDGTPFSAPVFALRPGLSPTGGTLLTTGDRRVEYRGAALSATKRLSGRWMLRGFLNYAETEWDVPAGFSAFDDPTDAHPGDVEDGDGQVSVEAVLAPTGEIFLNSRWQAHLSGLYRVAPDRPWGFDVAANLYAREGYPLPYYLRVVGADGQRRRVQAVGRVDDFRTDELVLVDLRLAKELRLLGERLGLTLSLDLFNALNEAPVLRRELQLNSRRADFVNETLGPRVWRLGLRLSWPSGME
ncbi:MAG TPA: TonB-dependent receptor [Thermoanaerobaculia bacterium]|nr:TonB-dependent receptor [Thermoanaerobaculia bacterium]